MSTHAIFRAPEPYNEPPNDFAPGTPAREELRRRLGELESQQLDIPLLIGGEEVRTGDTFDAVEPHNRSHVLATVHKGGTAEVERAIAAAGDAWQDWSRTPWEERAAVILRASELLAGPWRSTLNAATMLGQSKTAHQAEIDAACELIDFWRFNVEYMTRIYAEQPASSPGVWNRIEYRPLEGFVFAVTPFNFTAIGGNLRLCRADGEHRRLEARIDGGVLRVVADEALRGRGDAARRDQPRLRLRRGDRRPGACEPGLAGIHFTGSTGVFNGMWSTVASNLDRYRNYPRIVGETGGKDFIVAHRSADVDSLATAIVRGSFEYQGQKCSAASRVFVPSNLWPEVRDRVVAEVETLRMGDVSDFSNFMGAVIDGNSFATQKAAIDEARASGGTASVLVGGGTDDSAGILRRADGDRDDRPELPDDARRAVRPRRDRVRLRREALRRHARPDRPRRAVRTDRCGVRARALGRRRGG
jgi:NAD-dependent aldehyde dehydrogenases